MNVAILGTGRMGGAMAGTLAQAGFGVVVHNRTRSRAEAVAERTGAEVADSAAEAVADADVTLSVLADRPAVEAMFGGADGAVAGLRTGAVVCEMSTVEPEVSRSLVAEIRERGADLLDTPVSGSVPAVEAGTLTIMAGGDAGTLDAAMPVLDALSSRVFHMGELGTGAAMKLAVNAVVHALNQALSEALVLAESAGIDRAHAYDVLESGAAGAPFLTYKRPAFEDPDGTAVAFTLDLVAKDLELILALAERTGVPMSQAEANLRSAREAGEHLGERDMSALAVHLRERARARDRAP